MDWTVSEAERLDAFLAHHSDLSRSEAKKAIKAGVVMVNGKKITKAAFGVHAGDTVAMIPQAGPTVESRRAVSLPSHAHRSVDLSLEVLYEDDVCLVINKPAGVPVHPGSGADERATILNGIAYVFDEQSIPFVENAVLVHRLDKDTTGCLLIAKNPKAHRELQKQFKDRTVAKSYLAIVAGVPSPATATIDAPLGRNVLNRLKMSILGAGKSRAAKTTYRTLDASDECALLECDLHTGRTHQIRVHLSSIGHPILGDESYGSSESIQKSETYEVGSMCLHAAKLSFDSPVAGRQIVEAPLPEMFEGVLNNIGIESGFSSRGFMEA